MNLSESLLEAVEALLVVTPEKDKKLFLQEVRDILLANDPIVPIEHTKLFDKACEFLRSVETESR